MQDEPQAGEQPLDSSLRLAVMCDKTISDYLKGVGMSDNEHTRMKKTTAMLRQAILQHSALEVQMQLLAHRSKTYDHLDNAIYVMHEALEDLSMPYPGQRLLALSREQGEPEDAALAGHNDWRLVTERFPGTQSMLAFLDDFGVIQRPAKREDEYEWIFRFITDEEEE